MPGGAPTLGGCSSFANLTITVINVNNQPPIVTLQPLVTSFTEGDADGIRVLSQLDLVDGDAFGVLSSVTVTSDAGALATDNSCDALPGAGSAFDACATGRGSVLSDRPLLTAPANLGQGGGAVMDLPAGGGGFATVRDDVVVSVVDTVLDRPFTLMFWARQDAGNRGYFLAKGGTSPAVRYLGIYSNTVANQVTVYYERAVRGGEDLSRVTVRFDLPHRDLFLGGTGWQHVTLVVNYPVMTLIIGCNTIAPASISYRTDTGEVVSGQCPFFHF